MKSEADEARKPETWAKAVQGIQQNPQEPHDPPEPPRPLTNDENCDKENVQPLIECRVSEGNGISCDDLKSDDLKGDDLKSDDLNGDDLKDEVEQRPLPNNTVETLEIENIEDQKSPIWILPTEETKPRRRKKGKKKPTKIE